VRRCGWCSDADRPSEFDLGGVADGYGYIGPRFEVEFAAGNVGIVVDGRIVAAVQEANATLVGASALLTTTIPEQQKIIEALEEAGLRDKVKVMVGGAPVTRAWADKIGADGYAENAIAAVAVAKKLVGA